MSLFGDFGKPKPLCNSPACDNPLGPDDKLYCKACTQGTSWKTGRKKKERSGAKSIQTTLGHVTCPNCYETIPERFTPYREWHLKVGRQYYAQDIDQVEYRFRNGAITPVAIFEMTRADIGKGKLHDKYLSAVLDRLSGRDTQGRLVRLIADRLGTDAWIVVYRPNLSIFHAYNLQQDTGWYLFEGKTEYAKWLRSL